MERNREIAKLVNVLRRIARAARHAAWNRDPEAARFCVFQYNKVLARMTDLEPASAPLFGVLPDSASADVARIAAQELAAYFEDEAASTVGAGAQARGCGDRRAWSGRTRAGSCW
jgi:hypothetical protein